MDDENDSDSDEVNGERAEENQVVDEYKEFRRGVRVWKLNI